MLPGEGIFLPETLSAQKGVTVNDIFEFTGDLSDSYHRKLFSDFLKSYQDGELEHLLGPRWQPRDQGDITCPGCRGNSHKRKGFCTRVVQNLQGKVLFRISSGSMQHLWPYPPSFCRSSWSCHATDFT